MKEIQTCKILGAEVRARRKGLKLTQAELAMTSGTGVRFVGELENGKETCHVGKVLSVMRTLGLRWTVGVGSERQT
jgi:HTH-type transcriptional regulator/antitoxin HipB